LLDVDILRNNLSDMAEKARRNGLQFRPHFKTHQSRKIGEIVREYGVSSITVSSVSMATYFAGDWEEITIAIPFNTLEIDETNDLASKQKINLLVENWETLNFLNDKMKSSVGIYIEVDTGYKRSGVPFHRVDILEKMATFIQDSEKLHLKGLYCHAGHSYNARSEEEIQQISDESITRLSNLKREMTRSFPSLEVNFGDTPCCSVTENFGEVDSISPGNFMFYDLAQVNIGSCTTDQIAVCMVCPIIAKYPERGELIIYGGGIHFSKDRLQTNGMEYYGLPVHVGNEKRGTPLSDSFLISISQEHGIIKANAEIISELEVGDVIGILPVHSCLTANCMREYTTFYGDFYDHM